MVNRSEDRKLLDVLIAQGQSYKSLGHTMNYSETDIIACAVLEKLGLLNHDYLRRLHIDFAWIEEGGVFYDPIDNASYCDCKQEDLRWIPNDEFKVGDYFNQTAGYCFIQFLNNQDLTDTTLSDILRMRIKEYNGIIKEINLSKIPYFRSPLLWTSHGYDGVEEQYQSNLENGKANGVALSFPVSFIEEALEESSLRKAMDTKHVSSLSKEERSQLLGRVSGYKLKTKRPSVEAVAKLADTVIENVFKDQIKKLHDRMKSLDKNTAAYKAIKNIYDAMLEACKLNDPKTYFKDEKKIELERNIQILQKSSWNKTVQNAMTACFAVLSVIGIVFLLRNQEKRGSYCLFWTEGNKQSAEEAVHFCKTFTKQ